MRIFKKNKFIFFHQLDAMDCGPSCLAMILSFYNKDYPIQRLRELSYQSKDGVSLLGITEAAENLGLDNITIKIDDNVLKDFQDLFPCILHWNNNHFVVLKSIKKSLFSRSYKYYIADPAHGNICLNETDFKVKWFKQNEKGIALILKPNENFNSISAPEKLNISLKNILRYLSPHRSKLIWLFIFLFLSTSTVIIYPFLTQILIDQGVEGKNLDLIIYILLAQFSLFLGNSIFLIIRNWLILYMGTKLSISIIAEFFSKIFKLPLSYFDTKVLSDFTQRIQDNRRIESFLTSDSLLTLFSTLTLSVFMVILFYYNKETFILYILFTTISIIWSVYWLKKLKHLDYFKFQESINNQEIIHEIINGMTDIKLNSFESIKQKEWEDVQNKIFKINIKLLKIQQIQTVGFDLINQSKNILVTFLSAYFVIQDKMTIGELLSISYIIGQMNSPISQLISFSKTFQEAKLSMERLSEINYEKEEDSSNLDTITSQDNMYKFQIDKLDFQYEGPKSKKVLSNISFNIPAGKTTAIVGESGSGKTTLMKLLLNYYIPKKGLILINDININNISPRHLRSISGVVMQDGYIFSDTILNNIIMGNIYNEHFFKSAIKISNLEEVIQSLPLKEYTKIGVAGNGLSGGQKQRILIARAIYKNPEIIFLDEATSSLDTKNENIIHNNLQRFFTNKTVIIIAHRLSTVKNADQIVVINRGQIVEVGTHDELVSLKKNYYNLVKNQLELSA